MDPSKPRYLVLGGVGFIGRNLVHYLVENNLASKIRVVDKVLPATAFLSAAHKAAFDKVEFKQGNLVNPSTPPWAIRMGEDGRGQERASAERCTAWFAGSTCSHGDVLGCPQPTHATFRGPRPLPPRLLPPALCHAASIAACFNNDGEPFDYVINLAAETKYSQTEEVRPRSCPHALAPPPTRC